MFVHFTFKQGPVEVCWEQVEVLEEWELELQCLLEARHQHITSVCVFFWHIYLVHVWVLIVLS